MDTVDHPVDLSKDQGPLALCRWAAAAGAVVGRGHQEDGLPCQDAVAKLLTDDFGVIVVSDGAGSAPHSKEGATIAVETTVAVLRDALPWIDQEAVGDAVLYSCLEEMRNRADAKGCEIGDLAATLTFVGVSGSVYLAGSLGDGVLIAARPSLAIPEVVFAQDRGEYANETVFLTSSDARKRLRLRGASLDGVIGFLVMSDGAAESLVRRRDGTPARAVTRILSVLEDTASVAVERELRASVLPKLAERTRDDCSLAVLRRIHVDYDALRRMSVNFQKEALGCRNRRGLNGRLGVLDCLRGGTRSVGEITNSTHLSRTTVRRHKLALEKLIC